MNKTGNRRAVTENIMSITLRKLDSSHPEFNAQLSAVLAFEAEEDHAIDQAVLGILTDVKARGDAAVLDYSKRFDRISANDIASLELKQEELQAALNGLSPARRAALQARTGHQRPLQMSHCTPKALARRIEPKHFANNLYELSRSRQTSLTVT